MGRFSTKRANTLPSIVASSRASVSKAWSVTNGEREDHLNRADLHTYAPCTPCDRAPIAHGQHGVFVAYASSQGSTCVDRRLCLPEAWFSEAYAAKRARCGVPPAV